MSVDQKERAVAAIVGCVVSDAAGIVRYKYFHRSVIYSCNALLRNGAFHVIIDDVLLCSVTVQFMVYI